MMMIDTKMQITTRTRIVKAYQLWIFVFESNRAAMVMNRMHTNVRPLTNLELNKVGWDDSGWKNFFNIESLFFSRFAVSSPVSAYLYLDDRWKKK
jgi:hypothetical protein